MLAALALLSLTSGAIEEAPPATLEEHVQRFWEAAGPAERASRIPAILERGAPFTELREALRAGPSFASDVPRGKLLLRRTNPEGVEHPWVLLVPEDYDPARRSMLRVELHGGMGIEGWDFDGSWAEGWVPQGDHLVLLPAGWWDSMWWTASQSENLAALLDRIKRTYNVDENRILLVGSSDGCIGSIFYALREPTPYAAFGGSVGCPVRLTNPTLRIDGQMHLSNLAGQSFFLMNGGKDRLFPVQDIRDYWELFERSGATVDYREYPDEGHGFRISAEDERDWARFLFGTVRDPLPDRISWATERTDRYARRNWLEILELGESASDAEELRTDVVLPRICTGKYRRLKPPRKLPFGRVELERTDNHVRLRTAGVRKLKLLLSEDLFDLDDPIRVDINGVTVHEAAIERDPECLLRWAARDLDRTQLFSAELSLEVPNE